MDKKSSQNIIPSRGGAFHEITLRARLIIRLMADRRVSAWAKLVPIFSVIYWLFPIDLISGIPGLSAVDDVAILWFAQSIFIELCPPEVVSEITKQLSGGSPLADEAGDAGDEVVDGEVTDVTDKREG